MLLGAVYYWMFPQFYIEYFCNGPAAQAQFPVGFRLGGAVRPHPGAGGAGALDGQLAEEIAAFDQQIAAIPEAAAAGLTNYEAFLSFREEYLNAASQQLTVRRTWTWKPCCNRVYGGTNWYRIDGIQNTMELYDTQEESQRPW